MAGLIILFKNVDQAPIHFPNAAQVANGTGVKQVKDEQGSNTYAEIDEDIYGGYIKDGEGSYWPPEA